MNILGSSIRAIRMSKKLTQKDLAELTGFKQNTISNHENGNRTLDEVDIMKYAEALNVSPQSLFNYNKNQSSSKEDKTLTQITSISATLVDFRQKKVLNYATAQKREQDSKIREDNVTYIYTGRKSIAGPTILGDDSTLDYEVVSSSMVPRGANELVDITGDSMEPLIMKGSSVYIRHQPTVENGEIAIVRIEDGITCKRFYHKDSQVILKSENPNYDDIIIEAELVHIIGKVLI